MNELLLKRAQQGDPDAFESLMAHLEPLVWRICWHYTGDRESASDCGQEAMVRIWRMLPSFRADCALETWVYRITANCCLDELRRKRRSREFSLEPLREQGFDPPDPAPGTEQQVLQKEEHARLREAIADLPEEQRDALVLTQLEGKPYAEAARLLSVDEGTVKSRVSRARKRLRDLLRSGELSAEGGVQKEGNAPAASRSTVQHSRERRGPT